MFVIANIMDIGMTSMLLGTGQFVESNPIAAHILNDWGLIGMIAYKLIIVAIVMLIANIISIWKIDTSKKAPPLWNARRLRRGDPTAFC